MRLFLFQHARYDLAWRLSPLCPSLGCCFSAPASCKDNYNAHIVVTLRVHSCLIVKNMGARKAVYLIIVAVLLLGCLLDLAAGLA